MFYTNEFGQTFDLSQWTNEALNALALNMRRNNADRNAA